MPRSSILDNAAFRIAILDITQKTSVIALRYHVSYSYTRTMRRQYGRPYAPTAHYGDFTSGRWLENKTLVRDVKTLRVKEVMAKHGYCMNTVVDMRRYLGVTKHKVLRSKEFRDAVKTRPITEVAAMFGLGTTVVSKHRVKHHVGRIVSRALRNNPKFIDDVRSDRRAVDVAGHWGCTAAYVSMIRREAK